MQGFPEEVIKTICDVTLGDQELKSNIVWRGRSGTFGVFRGKEIRFVRLK